ncbi:BTB/POZ domain-containing protein NPY2-like isoform X1 [Cynara cardunculus var. scolymus]|uniref:BTB/POZ domain-containing protein NPY2-like isoform X1 n=1 Tax=Cynara cardunculus var. scolymus TaxID=59895 RepID=UPI000D6272A7|nr:BTB/POZ domain-containing protein NPY2-like isoform X1 [Cynara cardunculus var. scolymus]
MKFMKLGSKPDSFQTDDNNVWYVASELATDIIINVGDVKFYLHKFPLLSKSARLQKLVASTSEGNNGDEIDIHDIPGGPAAFEICAKFCYGMMVTLNAYNVVTARCAAEYLEMHETMEKGNLIYKIDVFLSSSIFRSWKDSIIVLQTMKSMMMLSEELKLVSHCIDSIASKVSVDVSKVDWSYTYNRKKLPEESDSHIMNGSLRSMTVPSDWWVEDLAELELDLYKRVLVNIKNKGLVHDEVIGEALKAFASRRLPGFNKGVIHSGDVLKTRSIVETVVCLLPAEKGSISCGFLLKLLKMAILVDSGEVVKMDLVKKIGRQLEEASVHDLLIRAREGEPTIHDVKTVQKIVEEFMVRDQDRNGVFEAEGNEIQEVRRSTGGILSEASKLMVAKLVDSYLAEIAKDPNLPLSMFVDLAETVSVFSRPAHDGMYRAIDMYLKAHPGISKSERKRICRLMDCKKLSVEACMHAVQNERLPLRVVVQVLFFEQVRAAASSGSSTPDLPKAIKDLNSGSSRSTTTNTEEDWDAVATAEELRALRGELASLRLEKNNGGHAKSPLADRSSVQKVTKRIFTKIWSSKSGNGENSGSDSSGSLGSGNRDEVKVGTGSTPSRKGRHSVS